MKKVKVFKEFSEKSINGAKCTYQFSKRREKVTESICREIMVENFSKLENDIGTQIQKL
jgi:hypothetical protein